MKKRSSLGVRLSLTVVIITTTVLAVFGFYRFSYNSAMLKRQLEKSLSNTVERLAFSLSNPFFNFHEKAIRDIILSEMNSKDILGIYMFDAQSNKLHFAYARINGKIKEIKDERLFAEALVKEAVIVFENEQLGTVKVFMTPLFMEQRLQEILISDISQIIILDLCLVILVIILLRSQIIKPITRLTQSSSEISTGELDQPIDIHSKDEIGTLAKGFAVMRASIKKQIVDLETENEERKKAEASLKISQEKYRTVVENANEAIVILQEDKIVYFNPKTCLMTGYSEEELLTKPFLDMMHPDDQKTVLERYIRGQAGGTIYDLHFFRIIGKHNNIVWGEIKTVIVSWEEKVATLCFINDITERKQSEELIIQAEKMMSVGGLAAGMAHEINNPLGGMLQGVQNIQRRLSPGLEKNVQSAKSHNINLNNLQDYLKERKILDFLTGISESGQRAAKIIKDMLLFSRKSESKMAPVDLLELMENVLDLAGKDYDLKKKHDFRNIKIKKEFEPNLPIVSCTKMEIEQVFLNLLNNAAWAMSNEKGGTPPQIILRARMNNQMVGIEIEDNGPGMDEEVRKRIFEPFFTTKPPGEGTGLGLSVSYMIITNNHSGTMEVESEMGKGTKFIIKLPMNGVAS